MVSPCNLYSKNMNSQIVGKIWLVGAAIKVMEKEVVAVGEVNTSATNRVKTVKIDARTMVLLVEAI